MELMAEKLGDDEIVHLFAGRYWQDGVISVGIISRGDQKYIRVSIKRSRMKNVALPGRFMDIEVVKSEISDAPVVPLAD